MHPQSAGASGPNGCRTSTVRLMRVAVGREVRPGERRVALTPETASGLVAAGADVVVQRGAGVPALAPDADFVAAGAEVAEGDVFAGADVVLHVRPLLAAEIARLPRGAVTVGFLSPSAEPE